MFGNSWRIGRIAGVELRVDTSWVLVALLVTYSLFARLSSNLDLDQPVAMLYAVGLALLFFGSVVFHEMAHAIASKRRGIPVRGITLFLFGGATHAKSEARRPADELIISIVGPLSSVLLAGVFWLAGSVLIEVVPLGGALRFLGRINLALAVFNMLPGFPLDGGRVLRSLIWQATGSLSKATKVASIAGQVVGYLIVGSGVVLLTQGLVSTAIWSAAIGWFLAQAARSSYAEVRVRRMLATVNAEDLMTPELDSIDADEIGEQTSVAPHAPMDEVLAKLQDGERRRVLVVRDGQVVGILTPSDIARWLDGHRAVTQ